MRLTEGRERTGGGKLIFIASTSFPRREEKGGGRERAKFKTGAIHSREKEEGNKVLLQQCSMMEEGEKGE